MWAEVSNAFDMEVQRYAERRLDARVRAVFEAQGALKSGVLDGFKDLEDDELKIFYRSLVQNLDPELQQYGVFLELIKVSATGAEKRRKVLAGTALDDYLPRETPVVFDLRAKGATEAGTAPAAVVKPAPPAGMPRRWPTRFGRSMTAGGDPVTLSNAEKAERERWVTRAVNVMRTADLPIVAAAEGSLDPDGLIAKALGNRRLRTLRLKTRGAERFGMWAAAVSADCWTDCLRGALGATDAGRRRPPVW